MDNMIISRAGIYRQIGIARMLGIEIGTIKPRCFKIGYPDLTVDLRQI